MWRAMRSVFVTGATGFIGRHLVRGLLDRGCAVRCLVRSRDRAKPLATTGAQLVVGTLAAPDGWQHALAGCDVVFHAGGLVAAGTRSELHAVNATATAALADACAAVESPPRLVHFSSLAAAGPVPRNAAPRDEASAPTPISQYGRSKLAGDLELSARAARLPITLLRPGVVFGPQDTKVTQIFQMIATLRLHLLMGFHDPPLSLIHVADLVTLAIAAADRGRRLDGGTDGTGIYHACDDREHPTYAALGRRIAAALDRSVVVLPLPLVLALPTAAVVATCWNVLGQASIVSPDKLREATVPSWAASAAQARHDLGFEPAATLDTRLRETADWLRSARLV
jgi:dihydroflavonol-4-reductase